MKKMFCAIVISVLVLFMGSVAMATEEAPNDYFDFSGGEDILIAPKVLNRATGEVYIEELLFVQIIGGGVAILTHVVDGEFAEDEVRWTDIKIVTPYDNQECTIPDLQHVECPGLVKWNELVKEGL